MRDFKKERGLSRRYLRMGLGLAGTLVLLLVAFAVTRAAWGMYGKFAEAAAARSDEEAQLVELEARYNEVKSNVTEFESPRGVEAQVRERYGVVRPGEGQITIVRTASTTQQSARQGSWWDKLWSVIHVW